MVDFTPTSLHKNINFPVCCCSKPQAINCSLGVSQGAYKIGEDILISGSIDNTSRNRELRGLTIELLEFAICKSGNTSGKEGSDSDEIVLIRVKERQEVKPGACLNMKNFEVKIPNSTSPTISGTCSRLILVHHAIKFWGEINGLFNGRILLGELPIHINSAE